MKKFILILLISNLVLSCAKDTEKKSVINEKSLDLQTREAYLEGLGALEKGDVLYAARKFNEVEILFPQSDLAPKSALMAAYSYYTKDYYEDCIMELDRFLKIYPKYKNTDYVYYFLGIAHYEQIIDEKRYLFNIKGKRIFWICKFKFSKHRVFNWCRIQNWVNKDILAAKELYVGRYYIKKWIPAINRFKNVINNYDTTMYVEEALYRLVEVYFLLGLKNEAKKYAKLLGYNYQNSQWYENSYIFFDQKYTNEEKKNKDINKNLIKNIKTFLKLDE